MDKPPNQLPPSESDDDASFHRQLLCGWRFNVMIITIILSVVGYFAFTLWGGWNSVVSATAQVGFAGIIVALLLSLVSFGLRFIRWQLFLKVLGHSIPWLPSLKIYIAGFSLTITPGKSGEALRSIFLKEHNISFRKSFGAFFSERLSDLIAVIVLAASGLWMHPEGQPILIVVAGIVIFLLYAIQNESWLKAVERGVRKTLPERFSNLIEFSLEMLIAFRSCFTPPILISGMILGVLAWGIQGVALYYILQKLNFNIDLVTSLFIYGFSLLVGAITLLPGGLGGTEVTMLKLLTLQNVPASEAVAATLIIRLATLWFSVLLGLLALPKQQKK